MSNSGWSELWAEGQARGADIDNLESLIRCALDSNGGSSVMAKCEKLRMILGELGRILEAKGIHSSYWISQLEQRLQEEEATRIASLMQKEIEYVESACFTPDEVKRWITEEIIGYEEVDVSEWGGAPWAVSEPYAKFPIYQNVEHMEVVRHGSYVPLLLQVKV